MYPDEVLRCIMISHITGSANSLQLEAGENETNEVLSHDPHKNNITSPRN